MTCARLKENPAKGMPARIYVDLQGANLALASKEPLAVDNGLLRQVRIGQYSADVVRVVLDMDKLLAHNAFMLPNPSRLVIDVLGKKRLPANPVREAAAVPRRRATAAQQRRKGPMPALSVNGLRKIVLGSRATAARIPALSASAASRRRTSFSALQKNWREN